MRCSERTYQNGSSPTVLLVHGAFADASSWAGVIPALLAAGMDVIAPANPLRGLRTDAAYIAGDGALRLSATETSELLLVDTPLVR